jgi:hypothetical protein
MNNNAAFNGLGRIGRRAEACAGAAEASPEEGGAGPAADDELRELGEFDTERSELFLSQTAVLVEGRTEKLVLPFVFEALG